MRLIKMYENYSNDVDVINNRVSFIKKFNSDVEDIFVELLDENFLVDVNVTNNNNNYKGFLKFCVVIQFSNFSKKDIFRFEDIRDSLVMFEDYSKECLIIPHPLGGSFFEIEITYHIDNSEWYYTDYVNSFENFGDPNIAGDMEWLESADMNRLKIEVYVKHD